MICKEFAHKAINEGLLDAAGYGEKGMLLLILFRGSVIAKAQH